MNIVREDASYERIIYNVVVLSSNVKQMVEQRVKSDVKINFENNQKTHFRTIDLNNPKVAE